MHFLIKHIVKNIGISLLLIISIFINFSANSEQSVEEIIKERKALFSKNYKTAKKVQSLSSSGNFDQAKTLKKGLRETLRYFVIPMSDIRKIEKKFKQSKKIKTKILKTFKRNCNGEFQTIDDHQFLCKNCISKKKSWKNFVKTQTMLNFRTF